MDSRSFELTAATALPGEVRAQARRLVRRCNRHDGTVGELFLSNEFNLHPELDAFYLARREGELVGVLTVYADSPETGEIAAYVLPDARGQGVFRALYDAACAGLRRFGYRDVLLRSERSFLSANDVMAHFGAAFDHGERLLIFNPSVPRPVVSPLPGFAVRPAREEDLPAAAALQAEAFGGTPELAQRYVRESFARAHLTLYVAVLGNLPLGCCSADDSGERTVLFGLCIAAAQRGKGLGRRMLREVLRLVRERAPGREISLLVDDGNDAALGLYHRCGFVEAGAQEYYRAPLGDG